MAFGILYILNCYRSFECILLSLYQNYIAGYSGRFRKFEAKSKVDYPRI